MPASPPIHIVNPNSSDWVTRSIEDAVRPVAGDVPVRFITLDEGPAAIESHEDFARAEQLVERYVTDHAESAAAFVIACFSDPGVVAARSATDRPVVGIQEASVESARAAGASFGILALAAASVERQRRSLEETGTSASWAGSRPVGVPLAGLEDHERAWPAVLDTARGLADEDGADVLILGCAGMGHFRTALEERTGLPVIDPCVVGFRTAREALATPRR